MLVETGEVVGETKSALAQYGQLQEGSKLSFKIPFPVGMDNLTKSAGEITQEKILEFIYPQIPDFDSKPEDYRKSNNSKSKRSYEIKRVFCRNI